MVTPVQLTLIGKPECHLCDVAQEIVGRVVGELSAAPSPVSVTVEHRSILDDSELYERYWEQIPVVLLNGTEHAHWHVDATALRAAILEV